MRGWSTQGSAVLQDISLSNTVTPLCYNSITFTFHYRLNTHIQTQMPYHSKKLPALVFCSLIDNNCFGWFLPRGVGRGWGHFSKSTKMRNEQKYAQAQLFNVSQNGVIQRCIALEKFLSLVQESSFLFDARNGIQTRVGQYQWTRCQRSTEYTK